LILGLAKVLKKKKIHHLKAGDAGPGLAGRTKLCILPAGFSHSGAGLSGAQAAEAGAIEVFEFPGVERCVMRPVCPDGGPRLHSALKALGRFCSGAWATFINGGS